MPESNVTNQIAKRNCEHVIICDQLCEHVIISDQLLVSKLVANFPLVLQFFMNSSGQAIPAVPL